MPDNFSFVGETGKITLDTKDDSEPQNLVNHLEFYDKLLPGNYRVGFSADQDNTQDRATLYNLEVKVDNNTLYTIANDTPITLKSPYFYNIFGNIALGPQQDSIIVGSVVHDSYGNIYMVGSHTNWGGEIENLFLKYSEVGDLVWRKTWTNESGFNCGSYNQSLRIDHDNNDMMYWCSYNMGTTRSYVGHMDTDGNLLRNPIELDGYFVSDIEPGGGNAVIIAGTDYTSGISVPFIAQLDVVTGAIDWTGNVVPNSSDLNYGTSLFHAITKDSTFEIAAIGEYNQPDGNLAVMFSHYGNEGYAYKIYRIGANTETEAETWAASVVAHQGNAYVMVNEEWYNSAYTSVVTKLEYVAGATQSDGTWNKVWQKRLGQNTGCVQIIGTSLAVSNGNVYATGTLVYGPYPVVALSQLDESTGTVNWSKVVATAIGGTASFPVNAEYGALISGTSDISIYDDRAAFGSYLIFEGDSSYTDAVMVQLPTDASISGIYGPVGVFDNGPIPNSTVDIGVDEISATFGISAVTTSVANLRATTTTETTGFGELHWDLTCDREITNI
jgi:hypothetical protein